MGGMGWLVRDAGKKFSGFAMRITRRIIVRDARRAGGCWGIGVCRGCCGRIGRGRWRSWRRCGGNDFGGEKNEIAVGGVWTNCDGSGLLRRLKPTLLKAAVRKSARVSRRRGNGGALCFWQPLACQLAAEDLACASLLRRGV